MSLDCKRATFDTLTNHRSLFLFIIVARLVLASLPFDALSFAAINTGVIKDRTSSELLEATFVGGNTCAQCHQLEHKLWSGSHHDLAMQLANRNPILPSTRYSSVLLRHVERLDSL